jgi:hypothetical protein
MSRGLVYEDQARGLIGGEWEGQDHNLRLPLALAQKGGPFGGRVDVI